MKRCSLMESLWQHAELITCKLSLNYDMGHDMNYSKQEIHDKLFQIFNKYKKRYKSPPKSRQMCCMWSTVNPPDIIEDTPPFHDIEAAFKISLGEDDCLELYGMDLDEATDKIADLLNIILKN